KVNSLVDPHRLIVLGLVAKRVTNLSKLSNQFAFQSGLLAYLSKRCLIVALALLHVSLREPPAVAHMDKSYFMIIAITPIDNSACRDFPDRPNILISRCRAGSDLFTQPPKISCAAGQQWHSDNLRNRITVQLAHAPFERWKKLFTRLDNEQFFIAFFDLALPPIGRLNRVNTVHAGCEFLADQCLREVLRLRRRCGGDIYDDEIQHQ